MPQHNARGGKAYKKKKKPVAEEIAEGDLRANRFEGAEEGEQDYGRVLSMLGNRRVRCFCNDGMERVCKIRQALCKGPKYKKIEVGDIVLLSFRDFETHADGRTEIADLIDKYSREQWRDIRKQPNIHANLFSGEASAATAAGAGLDIFEGEGAADTIKETEDTNSEEEEDEAEVNIDAI